MSWVVLSVLACGWVLLCLVLGIGLVMSVLDGKEDISGKEDGCDG